MSTFTPEIRIVSAQSASLLGLLVDRQIRAGQIHRFFSSLRMGKLGFNTLHGVRGPCAAGCPLAQNPAARSCWEDPCACPSCTAYKIYRGAAGPGAVARASVAREVVPQYKVATLAEELGGQVLWDPRDSLS